MTYDGASNIRQALPEFRPRAPSPGPPETAHSPPPPPAPPPRVPRHSSRSGPRSSLGASPSRRRAGASTGCPPVFAPFAPFAPNAPTPPPPPPPAPPPPRRVWRVSMCPPADAGRRDRGSGAQPCATEGCCATWGAEELCHFLGDCAAQIRWGSKHTRLAPMARANGTRQKCGIRNMKIFKDGCRSSPTATTPHTSPPPSPTPTIAMGVDTAVAVARTNPEPLLDENPNRFTMFPIQYGDIWEMYKKAEASFWTGECPVPLAPSLLLLLLLLLLFLPLLLLPLLLRILRLLLLRLLLLLPPPPPPSPPPPNGKTRILTSPRRRHPHFM